MHDATRTMTDKLHAAGDKIIFIRMNYKFNGMNLASQFGERVLSDANNISIVIASRSTCACNFTWFSRVLDSSESELCPMSKNCVRWYPWIYLRDILLVYGRWRAQLSLYTYHCYKKSCHDQHLLLRSYIINSIAATYDVLEMSNEGCPYILLSWNYKSYNDL